MPIRIKSLRRNRTLRLLAHITFILFLFYLVQLAFRKYLNKINSTENDKYNEEKELIIVESSKQFIRLYDLKQDNTNSFDCIKTKVISTIQTTICLHNIENDVFVSKELKEKGIWEEDLVKLFIRMLNADLSMNVLDIGAQLGQYCLFAVKAKHKCLAIEPFYDSYIRLHKSALIENTQDLIVLITNGISDTRGEYKRLTQVSNNVGGQSIFENNENYAFKMNRSELKNDKYIIETIVLNDIVHVLPKDFKNVIIKIDIQNYEIKAFKKADLLFKRLNIFAIFMEWNEKADINKFKVTEIEGFLDFLYSKHFSAHNPTNLNELERQEWKNWPYDIIWIKKNFHF